ncbi:MAG: undecaprenyl-phosphate glucose phosphotransferase [Chloroflexi bacterium]|nr:MAG: undecaprenyl-phosphate glucose phosphotransferase [Chloroflexota bacterium]RLT55043.1 MAG: undecaprenyl-phosphate glucose phosphotransferase [Chloroflexota bacterium]
MPQRLVRGQADPDLPMGTELGGRRRRTRMKVTGTGVAVSEDHPSSPGGQISDLGGDDRPAISFPERRPGSSSMYRAVARAVVPTVSLTTFQRIALTPAFLVVFDTLAIGAGFLVAYVLRFVLQLPVADEVHSLRSYAGFLSLATPVTLVAFAAYGLYQTRQLVNAIDQVFRLFTAVLVGLVVTVAIASFVIRGWPDYSRLLVAYVWLACSLLSFLGRLMWIRWRGWLASRGTGVRTTLIVGAGSAGVRVAQHFARSSHLGYRVAGFIDGTLPVGATPAGTVIPVVGKLDMIDDILIAIQPQELILADPTLSNLELMKLVNRCEGQPVGIRVYPDLFQTLVNDASLVNLQGLPLVSLRASELEGWQRSVKRVFDVMFSGTVLILTAPMMLVIALLVRLESPGPVFFAQERLGQDGKRFHAIKFRSMVQDAEKRTGQFWTVPNDPRRTRIGTFLRRHSLDEWPQFINVLVGDMSVVGPRPERPMFVAQFSESVPDYLRRLRERAGLTGWAQVNGLRGDVPIEERTKYDLYYVDNWSLWLDIKIILRTAILLVRDSSAY